MVSPRCAVGSQLVMVYERRGTWAYGCKKAKKSPAVSFGLAQ